MLLPSSLPCDDARAATATAAAAAAADLASPPYTPPPSNSRPTFDNILRSCRSLQSLIALSGPPPQSPPSSSPSSSTPAAADEPKPAPAPLKMRLRPRPADRQPRYSKTVSSSTFSHPCPSSASSSPSLRKRPARQSAPKRPRLLDDDAAAAAMLFAPPATPRPARIAPFHLPLGLARSDFHDLHVLQASADAAPARHRETSPDQHAADEDVDGDGWSVEQDRILVELVLDKLRLSKDQWRDCARSLGKDRGSVTRRWRSLVARGDVGVTRARRGGIPSHWR